MGEHYPSWESTYVMFYEASPNPHNWARLVVQERIRAAMERAHEQAAASRHQLDEDQEAHSHPRR